MTHRETEPAGHLVLLGDSIIDNGNYVAVGEPDVAAQIAAAMPGWEVTSLARDGAVIADVRARQLPAVPDDADCILLCIGGNDLLGAAGVLMAPARTVADALNILERTLGPIAVAYIELLGYALSRGLPVVAVLPYEPAFHDDAQRSAAALSLALYSDAVLRDIAVLNRCSVLDVRAVDLRDVCDEPGDLANPIEPSAIGGAKIAAAVAAAVAGGRVPV